jgi:hypothetical protein
MLQYKSIERIGFKLVSFGGKIGSGKILSNRVCICPTL